MLRKNNHLNFKRSAFQLTREQKELAFPLLTSLIHNIETYADDLFNQWISDLEQDKDKNSHWSLLVLVANFSIFVLGQSPGSDKVIQDIFSDDKCLYLSQIHKYELFCMKLLYRHVRILIPIHFQNSTSNWSRIQHKVDLDFCNPLPERDCVHYEKPSYPDEFLPSDQRKLDNFQSRKEIAMRCEYADPHTDQNLHLFPFSNYYNVNYWVRLSKITDDTILHATYWSRIRVVLLHIFGPSDPIINDWNALESLGTDDKRNETAITARLLVIFNKVLQKEGSDPLLLLTGVSTFSYNPEAARVYDRLQAQVLDKTSSLTKQEPYRIPPKGRSACPPFSSQTYRAG